MCEDIYNTVGRKATASRIKVNPLHDIGFFLLKIHFHFCYINILVKIYIKYAKATFLHNNVSMAVHKSPSLIKCKLTVSSILKTCFCFTELDLLQAISVPFEDPKHVYFAEGLHGLHAFGLRAGGQPHHQLPLRQWLI
jgi:hypothetical protein